MKGIKKITFCLILTYWGIINANAQSFLSEGFEGGGKPSTWNIDIYGSSWFFQNGGYASTSAPNYHHPATAHTGSFNAMFKTFGSALSSKLITPAMDLRFAIKPVLTFWHAQDYALLSDQLKVFYRVSTTSSWVQLDEYLNPTSDWTLREIILPDAAKVQTCQIAFEGTSQLGSWGMCLDDIKVEDKGILPRQVGSISLIQNNYFIPSGSSTNSLGILDITVSGNTGNIPLNSVSIEYNGSDINDLNISNFEIFYTRDTIFSPITKLTPTISNTGNTISFSNLNYNLQTGENMFWICASTKTTAVHGNIADFKVLQNNIDVGGVQYPAGNLDPSGYSTIEESIFYDGFESSSVWQFSPGACWQIGVPTGLGTYDPNYAFSGQKVMATNLSGNYPNGIHPSNPHTATTPSINCKYYQNINIRFKRWLNFDYFDQTSIQYSLDGGTTWNFLWKNATLLQDQNWKNVSYNISQQATRKQNVKIRLSIDSTDNTGDFGGWNIDNFAITGDFIAKDVGVSTSTSPVTHCGMTNSETVTVKIKNYGGATINTPFDVGFSLDNGVTYTKETVNQTIASEAEITYTFTAKANLLSPGLKQLAFKTFLVGDEDASNDKYSTTLFVFPTEQYIYSTSFETSNKYWNPGGTNSTWAWGIVAKPIINKASDGTKVWVTSLKGNHAISEVSYLESPCFDFSTAEYPVFAFDYWVNTENGVDGFRLDYSVDGGTTWNPVTANSNHNLNWCTGTSVTSLGTDGWTGSTSTGYQLARTLLPTSVLGKNNVKFRFFFAADANSSMEGVAIDNIRIYELPYDVGVKRLVSPISGCYIGNNVHLTAKIKNYGYRPLKSGLKIPLEIKLRTDNVVKDTLVVGSLVTQNDSASFTSTGTYNIFTKGSHALRLNTNITPELNRINDTLKTTLQVKGIPGYTLGANKAVPGPTPISVELDAGAGYNSYLWSTTETTQKITVTNFGTYNVIVTNENSCTAKDTIDVVESTNDIQILSVSNLDNACTYPTSVYPQISIKNNGPSGVGNSYTMKNIPLSIMVDGVVKVSELFTPSSDLNSGGTTSFTFTNPINIATPKTYDIRIYSKINEDPNKNNDTLKVATQVWGMPDVHFPQDTIVSTMADTLVLDAGSGFASYTWANSSVTTQTFNVSSLHSAWYKVTVTDSHSCGSDKDSVYINAKDLSVINIESPFNAFCGSPVPKVAVRVKNAGQDDFNTGSIIKLSYITPSESVSQNFTLTSPLVVDNSTLLTFDNYIKTPIGEGFVRVTGDITGDPNPSNNVLEKSVIKLSNPTVSFNPSTLYKVFGADPYVVAPIYGSDVKSFLWQDYSTDSLYTIVGTPTSNTLQVIAYDGLGLVGCTDTASLSIIAQDMVVDAIKSPTNQCVLGSGVPVKVTIANKGNFSYPAGTSYTIGINVDGINYPNEVKTLSTQLDPNGKIDLTLNPVLDLTGKTNSNTQISVSTAYDADLNDNTLNKTVYATGFPTISLGVDRTIHAWSDTLRAGSKFSSYSWKYNSSNVGSDSTLVTTQTGTYSITVTDFNGCPATDDIVLTFVVDDISLQSLDNPVSGCNLKDNENVKMTVKNTGTEIIPNGKQIELGYIHEGVTNKENFTLTSNLNAGQSRSFNLAGIMNLPTYKSYVDTVWVKMVGDMKSSNDTLVTTIDKYLPVGNIFVSSLDTIKVKGSDTTIVANTGYLSYLWSTGATTESIPVTISGSYWAELSNNHCVGRDTIYVKFVHDISVDSLIAPQPTLCSHPASETFTVRLKNTGQNEIPTGTVIHLKLKIASTLVATENYALTSNLGVGNYVDYSFTYKQVLVAGYNTIDITAQMNDDVVASNNTISKTIHVFQSPAPDLGLDRTITSTTILNPGTDVSFNYTWQDGSHNPTLSVSASGLYSVTVTDPNSITAYTPSGCSGYDEVNITWQETSDVRITQLISPGAANCYNSQGQTVIAQLTNTGSHTFTSGESISVSYQIGSNTPVVETLNFTSNFANGQTQNYTFSQKASLSLGAVTMYLKTIISSVSGLTSSYPVSINAKPVVDLGPDTIRTTLPYNLNSNISGVTYLWNTGSTSASITITGTAFGKYWLVATNPSGCSAKDSVVIWWPVNVEMIPGSNAKVTLYPNPVNNELTITIETDIYEAFSFDFINPQGQVIKKLKTEKTLYFTDKINVAGYSPGVYFLKVSAKKGSTVFKVIVQR